MWFVGLLLGLLLGSLTGKGAWVLGCGILGLVGGLIYGDRSKRLEQRVDALEKLVRQLSSQIAALQSAQPQTSNKGEPASAAVQPEPAAPQHWGQHWGQSVRRDRRYIQRVRVP